MITGADQNNHGPANIGQAKHMVKSALEALHSVLPLVADQIEADLVEERPNPQDPANPLPPILQLQVPVSKTPEWIEQQKAPLLNGQLKAIAHQFYFHLDAAASVWLAEQRAANGTESGGIFPWTEDRSDDNHHGMANLGQLKAVFSLHFTRDTDEDGLPDLIEHILGTNPNQSMTYPGIPDAWVAANFPPGQGFDPNGDPDGDGITNALENQLGLDPNSHDPTGLVNPSFSEEITDSPTLSFREEYPSDLYEQSSVEGWQADIGGHIEIWDEDDGNPYVELQSHWGSHGIKQEFDMLPDSRVSFILRYKGRYEYEAYDNAFKLKVEGASELIVNGNTVAGSGETKSHSFMEEDEWEDHKDWHYASVSITAPPGTSGLMSVILSLVPNTTTTGTDEITYGGFVDIIPVDIVPDYNRDGMINAVDRNKVTEENPFYFWVNNDDDGNSDPEMQDILAANLDNGDMEVNTARDLVDFFPVQLRIQELLRVLPPSGHSYKISHPDGAFNFIEMPDIHPDSSPEAQGAGSYLRNSAVADEAVAGQMKATAGGGAELSAGFLDACLEGRGILLFEAVKETQNSFELVISKKNGGDEVARIRRALPVEIVANPEAFYWRLNLRPASDGQNVGDAEPPANAKFRDSRKDRWFVFVHGYNVNFNQSRDRNAEIFKRLYQMGNDSKYVAVSWTGDVSQIGGGDAVISPDYWRNVYNAFASSSPLAHKINGLTGSAKEKTVIAAHSLGNMVVSSAICDHGLKAEKYFMMNSAVAKEAFIPSITTTERNVMSHPDWRTDPVYPDRLWASNWYNLFTDARKNLTWQGRFESLKNKTSPWNYYSTGETTAASNDGSLPIGVLVNGKRAWVAQEMFKGSTLQGIVSGWYKGAWNSHGGWAFNLNAYTEYRPNPLNPPGEPKDTSEIPNAALKSIPFFDPWTVLKMENGGANPNSSGTPVTDPNQGAAAHAAEYSVRAWMLAYEIPALSNPTASGPLELISNGNVVEYGNSTNMNTDLRSGVWGEWQHGDYYRRDMDHVGKLYDDWTTKGNLRK